MPDYTEDTTEAARKRSPSGGEILNPAKRMLERAWENERIKCAVAILLVGFVGLEVTLLLATVVGVRGILLFPDTALVLIWFGVSMVCGAAIWDGVLLAFGLLRSFLDQWHVIAPMDRRWSSVWRRWGFFSIGVWPLVFVGITMFFMIGTANVSNISLKLLETTTTWNDAFFWAIEEPLLVALTSGPIHLDFWETIYNSAWNAEMLVLSAVLVATRCPVWGARFCVSFILLFYLGRLFGLASPVLGPALFAPEHFGYLEGSITNSMMQSVSATIEAGPNGIEKSAILLGGVAAMPSLHVGMISLASWWLARSVHIATPFVVLWLLTVWTSTVLLGWHYVFDGLGGILTAALCIWLTSLILKGLRVGEPAPAIGVPGLLRRRLTCSHQTRPSSTGIFQS